MRIKYYLLFILFLVGCTNTFDYIASNSTPIPIKVEFPPQWTTSPTAEISVPNITPLITQIKIIPPTITKVFNKYIATMEKSNDEQLMIESEERSKHIDKCNELSFLELSPTHNWLICISKENNDPAPDYLIVGLKNKITWTINYAGLLGEEKNYFDPGIASEYWSKDDKYLYIIAFTPGDDSNPIFHQGKLFRFNLLNGNISPILNDRNYIFKISPSGNIIAYHEEYDSERIYIKNLFSDEITFISMPEEWSYGRLLWSLNENMIVMCSIKADEYGKYYFSNYLINIRNNDVKRIYLTEDSHKELIPIAWEDNEKILFAESDSFYSSGNIDKYLEYDIERNEFVTINK
jgi:hypothetical protein